MDEVVKMLVKSVSNRLNWQETGQIGQRFASTAAGKLAMQWRSNGGEMVKWRRNGQMAAKQGAGGSSRGRVKPIPEKDKFTLPFGVVKSSQTGQNWSKIWSKRRVDLESPRYGRQQSKVVKMWPKIGQNVAQGGQKRRQGQIGQIEREFVCVCV
jgi:hypothetical protein